MYCQFSNIRRTQSPIINVSRLVLQMSLPNPLKPGVKLRMKMLLEQRRQAMLQLHLSDQQFYCLLRCALYYRLYGTHWKQQTVPWPALSYQDPYQPVAATWAAAPSLVRVPDNRGCSVPPSPGGRLLATADLRDCYGTRRTGTRSHQSCGNLDRKHFLYF